MTYCFYSLDIVRDALFFEFCYKLKNSAYQVDFFFEILGMNRSSDLLLFFFQEFTVIVLYPKYNALSTNLPSTHHILLDSYDRYYIFQKHLYFLTKMKYQHGSLDAPSRV